MHTKTAFSRYRTRCLLIQPCLLAFAFLGAGCSSQGDKKPDPSPSADFSLEAEKKISLKLLWQRSPVASQFLTVNVQFSAPEGIPLQDIQLSRFKPWMTSMGHGGYEDEQKITKSPENPREFKVENVYFTMPGKWDIEVAATWNNKPLQFKESIEVGAD